MTGSAVAPANDGDIKALITAFEKRALELWNGGNPDGFIEFSSDDVVCFDPALESNIRPMRFQVSIRMIRNM